VVLETVRLGPNSLQAGEVLEQRVAGARNQHRLPRAAKQLEQPRVCLARARREHDVVRIDLRSTTTVIVRDRGTRLPHAKRMRLVTEAAFVGE